MDLQAVGGHGVFENIRLRSHEPLIKIAAGLTLAVLLGFLRRGQFALQGVPARAVPVAGHEQDGRRVLHVPVHRILRRVIEERTHGVEVLGSDRIEFVIVAHRAAGGEAHEDLAGRLCAVAGVEHEILLGDRAAFIGGDIAAIEAGRDLLIQCGVRQQIAGELLNGELIERQVAVEGADDPLAVVPHLAVVVEMNAVRVRIARGIQPVARAVLAVMRGRHELVEIALVGIRRVVVHKLLHQRRLRRQAGDIERCAPRQRAAVRFRIRC